jgi:hypothetical protein
MCQLHLNPIARKYEMNDINVVSTSKKNDYIYFLILKIDLLHLTDQQGDQKVAKTVA